MSKNSRAKRNCQFIIEEGEEKNSFGSLNDRIFRAEWRRDDIGTRIRVRQIRFIIMHEKKVIFCWNKVIFIEEQEKIRTYYTRNFD